MPESRGSVREIVWREVFPWLLLVRSFRAATQVGQLALGSAGVLATIFGWWLLARVFSGTEEQPLADWIGAYESCPWRDVSPAAPQQTTPLPLSDAWQDAPPRLGRFPGNPFVGPWQQLRAPFVGLFHAELGATGLAFLLLACLWAAAVWALFGGAITRRAALQLGREENIGMRAALHYAASKWGSYFAAPLLPLLGVAMAAVPVWLLGLVMRLDAGTLLAGILWPLALLAGFFMALLLLALLFGWPLMWPTISTEGTDSFDALSRAWSYVYHRPLHYLFYAVIVSVLGWLGWLFVSTFADWVAYLPEWAASWGAGQARLAELSGDLETEPGALGRWGWSLIGFWNGCIRLAALGFVYSYFWTASTAIYLLLRHDDDGTEIDDINVDSPAPAYGLPPLDVDAAGAPVVAKEEPNEIADPVEPPPGAGHSPDAEALG
ncbi:MAG TPA: hypothetical protein VGN42_28540 [Pirellulales bacterium]|jgi:hypothetical protein|nr:hypothetical protein [Pirellulales bacterium]